MLAGSLSEFSIQDVVSLLAATRKGGTLQLTGDEREGRVWFLDGRLVYAVADVERVPLGARLAHEGLAEEAQVAELVAAQREGRPGRVAGLLRDDLGLDEGRVGELLADALVDALFEVRRWDAGRFSFDLGEVAGPEVPTFDAGELMGRVEGRLAEWQGFAEHVPAGGAVLEMVPRADGGDVHLTAAQWALLTLVDGRRTVEAIVEASGRGTFAASRELASLAERGLIRGVERPMAVAGAEPAVGERPGPDEASAAAGEPAAGDAAAAPAVTLGLLAPPVEEPPAEEPVAAPSYRDLLNVGELKLPEVDDPDVPAVDEDEAAPRSVLSEAASWLSSDLLDLETPSSADEGDEPAIVAAFEGSSASALDAVEPVEGPSSEASEAAPAEAPGVAPDEAAPVEPTQVEAAPVVGHVDRAQVARELASLGLDGPSDHADGADGPLNKGLILRLIDGVKGA